MATLRLPLTPELAYYTHQENQDRYHVLEAPVAALKLDGEPTYADAPWRNSYVRLSVILGRDLTYTERYALPQGYHFNTETRELWRWEDKFRNFPTTGHEWQPWIVDLDLGEDPEVFMQWPDGACANWYASFVLNHREAVPVEPGEVIEGPNVLSASIGHVIMKRGFKNGCAGAGIKLSALLHDPYCAPIDQSDGRLIGHWDHKRLKNNNVNDLVKALFPKALQPVAEAPKPKAAGRAFIFEEERKELVPARMDPMLFLPIDPFYRGEPLPFLTLGLSPRRDGYRPFKLPDYLFQDQWQGYAKSRGAVPVERV